jgi:hypothetical protein
MMLCVGNWNWCNGDVPLPEHCRVMPIYSDRRQSNILCGTCADLTGEGDGELLLSSVPVPRCAGRALLLRGLCRRQNGYTSAYTDGQKVTQPAIHETDCWADG